MSSFRPDPDINTTAPAADLQHDDTLHAPDMRPVTNVVAAVIMRPAAHMGATGNREFLLVRRPPGKAYEGYWEFPGGKVEPDETPADACRRELREELGIEAGELRPWITREFTYPHARVRIKFFRLSAWRGTVTLLEHTGLVWLSMGKMGDEKSQEEPPPVTPILPANGPILKALSLPTTYAITCAAEFGIEEEILRTAKALAAGVRLFQIRDKEIAPELRTRLTRQIIQLARPFGARVLVNGDAELALATGAHGLHVSSSELMQLEARPDFSWVGASCHSPAELAHAAALNLDFAVLGPVLPTKTHPSTPALGWEKFSEWVDGSSLPVFALGGMRPGLVDLAQQNHGHGIAVMRGWPG